MPLALRYPNFRRVFYARITSEFGDWAARLAVTALVYQQTGSVALAGLAVVATLGAALLGPLVSSLGDVYPPRAVMVASDLVRVAIFVLLALVPMPPLLLVGLVFLAGLANEPFSAVRVAILPDLGPDPNDAQNHDRYLDSANNLSEYTSQTVQLLSLASGGLALALMPPQAVLLINASTFLLSAAFLLDLSLPSREVSSGARAALGSGLTAIRTNRLLLALVLLAPLGTMAAVTLEALVAVVAQESGAQAGLLAPAAPLGTIAGIFILGRLPAAKTSQALWRRSLTVLALGNGGALLILSTGWSGGVLAAGYFCAGTAFAFFVPAKRLLLEVIPQRCRASVFGVLDSGLLTVQAAALAGASLLAETAGLKASLLCLLALSLACLPLAARLAARPRPSGALLAGGPLPVGALS